MLRLNEGRGIQTSILVSANEHKTERVHGKYQGHWDMWYRIMHIRAVHFRTPRTCYLEHLILDKWLQLSI